VMDTLERDLELVGTTAIEDKLQDGVPETIQLLSAAGIKIWVLTGDKQETAVNIACACRLLNDDMGLFTFDAANEGNITQILQCYATDASNSTQDMGLVIEGSVLHFVLPENHDEQKLERCTQLFLMLASRCRSVVCCRVSPLQKAQIVLLVKLNLGAVTLAIGDGANDVPMIQSAHVGVGISGLEGLQAARSADYSIAQFRFLQRLILLHGRYNYKRIVRVILYCFYKNMTLYLAQFWFTTVNFVSGQSLFDPWALPAYNVIFAAFPIMIYGVVDRDVQFSRLLNADQFPELFHDGLTGRLLTTRTFWLSLFNAVVQSGVCCYLVLFVIQYWPDEKGRELGLAGAGCVAYTAVLSVISFKLALDISSWTVITVIVGVTSVLLWFVFLGIYGNLYSVLSSREFFNWYGMPAVALTQPLFWLTAVLLSVVCLLRDVIWKVWNHNMSPKLVHVIQDFEQTGRPFSRADLVRYAPQMLSKIKPRPYAPVQPGPNVLSEDDTTFLPKFEFSDLATEASNGEGPKEMKRTSPQPQNVRRVPLSGTVIAKPGSIKITEMLMEEDDFL